MSFAVSINRILCDVMIDNLLRKIKESAYGAVVFCLALSLCGLY